MANSQSESPLPPPLKVRGARGVMKLNQGFAEGKRTMPGPGRNVVLCAVRGFSQQNVVRGFSLVPESMTLKGRTTDFWKGQPDNEAGLKFGFTEEKCFQ